MGEVLVCRGQSSEAAQELELVVTSCFCIVSEFPQSICHAHGLRFACCRVHIAGSNQEELSQNGADHGGLRLGGNVAED